MAARCCHKRGCTRQAMQPYSYCRRHVAVTRPSLYRVWACLSAHPHASVRELARLAGLAHTTVRAALIVMARIGILTYEPYKSRTWRLREPFNWFDG